MFQFQSFHRNKIGCGYRPKVTTVVMFYSWCSCEFIVIQRHLTSFINFVKYMSSERVRAFCIRAVVWFSVTIRSKQVLIWFCLTLLCDCLAKLTPPQLRHLSSPSFSRKEDRGPWERGWHHLLSQWEAKPTSIINKLLAHNFLRLASTKCNGFQFRLAHWVACVCCDWVFRYIFIHSFSCINSRYTCVSSAIIRPFFLFIVIIMISIKSNTSTMNNRGYLI